MKLLVRICRPSVAGRSSTFRWLKALLLLAVWPAAVSATNIPAWVLVMQNPDAAQTIVSTDVSERDHLIQAGWKLTGSGLLSTEGGPDSGLLHRMLQTSPEVMRRLAVTPEEVAANLKAGFVTEGALGYVALKAAPGLVAVHCFRKGDRLIWVSGQHEQYWADNNGWKREGATFWLLSLASQ